MATNDTVSASEEDDLAVSELADVCEALVAAWNLDGSQSGGGAAPGSAFAIDVLSIREALPEDRPLNLEYAHVHMAGQMVNAIVLQLQSVVTLLRANPMIPLGVWPLVRSELEYAGRVAWLLEPFPGEDAGRVRVARGMLEHLAALQRQRFTAGKWDKQRAKQFSAKRDELLASIRVLFDEVDTPMDNPQNIDAWQIGGETMLPLGRAVSLYVKLNMTEGEALYDVLSDNSHPSVISLAFQSNTSSAAGVTSTFYPANPRVVNFQVRLASTIAYKAALMILRYSGFLTPALDRWATEAPAHWFVSKSNEDQ